MSAEYARRSIKVSVRFTEAEHELLKKRMAVTGTGNQPEEIARKEWVDNAYRLRDAADPAAPVRPELLEFESKLHRDFAKARSRARSFMRQDKFDEARKVLHDTLARQAKETFEFLANLK